MIVKPSSRLFLVVFFIFSFALGMKMAPGQTQNTEREDLCRNECLHYDIFFSSSFFCLLFHKGFKLFPFIFIVHSIFWVSISFLRVFPSSSFSFMRHFMNERMTNGPMRRQRSSRARLADRIEFTSFSSISNFRYFICIAPMLTFCTNPF